MFCFVAYKQENLHTGVFRLPIWRGETKSQTTLPSSVERRDFFGDATHKCDDKYSVFWELAVMMRMLTFSIHISIKNTL